MSVLETTEVTERCAVVMPAKELAAKLHDATLFASTDRARPGLMVVNVDRSAEETVFVATDSYQLGVVTVTADGPEGSWSIPLDVVKTWIKALPAFGSAALILGDGEATLTAVGIEFTCRLEEMDYPNWRSLWPVDADCVVDSTMGWTRSFLARYAKLKSVEKAAALKFRPHGLKPAVWSVGSDIRGLLMPCRTS